MALDKNGLKQKASIFKVREIHPPDLGDSVYVRELNTRELERVRKLCSVDSADDDNTRAKILVMLIGDANGKRLFTDSEVDVIQGMNWKITDYILAQGLEFNAEQESVEQAEKN
jgi:hypothetical protein